MSVAQQLEQKATTAKRDPVHVNVRLSEDNSLSATAVALESFERKIFKAPEDSTTKAWKAVKEMIALANQQLINDKITGGPNGLPLIEYPGATKQVEKTTPFEDLISLAKIYSQKEQEHEPKNKDGFLPSFDNIDKYIKLISNNQDIGTRKSNGVSVSMLLKPWQEAKINWEVEVGSKLRREFQANPSIQAEHKAQQEKQAEEKNRIALEEKRENFRANQRVANLAVLSERYFKGDAKTQERVIEAIQKYFEYTEQNPDAGRRDNDLIIENFRAKVEWALDARKIITQYMRDFPHHQETQKQEAAEKQRVLTLTSAISKHQPVADALEAGDKKAALLAFGKIRDDITPEELSILKQTKSDRAKGFINFALEHKKTTDTLFNNGRKFHADIQNIATNLAEDMKGLNITAETRRDLITSIKGLHQATQQNTKAVLHALTNKEPLTPSTYDEIRKHTATFVQAIEEIKQDNSSGETWNNFNGLRNQILSSVSENLKTTIGYDIPATSGLDRYTKSLDLIAKRNPEDADIEIPVLTSKVEPKTKEAATTAEIIPIQPKKQDGLAGAFHSMKTKVFNLFRSKDAFNAEAQDQATQIREQQLVQRVA